MSKLLDRYFKENFFLIPIRKNDKRPLYKKWNQYSLSYMEAKQFIKEGYNIGVVAKDLFILDFDMRIRDSVPFNVDTYRDFGTCVQFTPRGFHVFLRCPDVLNQNLLSKFNTPEPDTIRHGDMYALLAPSKVDGKSYWWLDNMKGEILTL